MAGISILIVFFGLFIVVLSTMAAITLFFVSISIRRFKERNAKIILVISLLLLIPLGVTILGAVIAVQREHREIRERLELIENKFSVPKLEWREGFAYGDKTLVPVSIFVNAKNYHPVGESKNLEYLGAVIIGNSYNYYSFYKIDNNSGYDIYYVDYDFGDFENFADFVHGGIFSTTFVDKNDYDAVLDYYGASDLSASVNWVSAPEDVSRKYAGAGLDLIINARRDEWFRLCHEVLDDVSDRKRPVMPDRDGYDYMIFNIKSDDGVFAVDLNIYAKDGEIILYLNRYKVKDEIVEKYKEMLLSLIGDTQAEILQNAAEK